MRRQQMRLWTYQVFQKLVTISSSSASALKTTASGSALSRRIVGWIREEQTVMFCTFVVQWNVSLKSLLTVYQVWVTDIQFRNEWSTFTFDLIQVDGGVDLSGSSGIRILQNTWRNFSIVKQMNSQLNQKCFWIRYKRHYYSGMAGGDVILLSFRCETLPC